jgi:peptide/nickel transport system substrate-binding protein
MKDNYWQRILDQRITRRRALAVTGATSLGAAFLAACGDDDGGGGGGPTGPADRSGLLAPVRDETSSAVPGGTFPYNHSNNVVTLDPHATFNGAAFGLIAPVYSTMVKYGKDIENFPGPDKITGDAMQSWENSPDGLRVTYKLRPNHKFDPRPPTNGRAMTVEDVKWSWERVKAVSPITADILREKSPTGTIENFEFPDANTVVVKLAEPYGGLQETLAYWYLFIGPIEGEDKVDLKAEMRGSGPFRLDKHQPSVDMDYVRNPDWYEKGQPFLDGFKTLYISEPAAQEAQFQAGNLWTTGADFLPETILRLKKDFPAVEMRAQSVYGAPGQYPLLFGKRFAADVRLRRAVSMMVDRAAMLEAAYGTTIYEDAGLDVKTYWDGHLANRAGEWLDPSTEELGEGAKFFKHDPAEAKKLLEAAGYKNEKLHLDFRAGFGPNGVLDIIHGMLQSGGLNVDQRANEANAWRDLKATSGAGYDDFLWSTANSYNAEGFLATKYTPGGKDKVTPNAIPGITDSILKMRRELDNTKRVEMIKQIQKDLAMEMPDLPVVSTLSVAGYQLTQPWLRNYRWIQPGFNQWASTARPMTVYWYDKSKQT